MTPQEEQMMMQAYVRQQLLRQQQPNLALPQQPVGDPQQFMQSPIGAGASPQPVQPYQVPGLEMQGELSGQQLGAGLKPMMKYPPNLQMMYRTQVPF
jgi:hypothetical protein